MENYNSMFGYFFAIVGVMCLYYAYTGKGMPYKNNYPKKIKEEADKLLRVFLWIIGPLVLVQGVLDIKGISAKYGFLYPIFLVLVLGAIVVYTIIFKKRYGKIIKESESQEINKSL